MSLSLDGLTTVRQLARDHGAGYHAIYRYAADGAFGDPLSIGRQHLYDRDSAERALAARGFSRAPKHPGVTPVAA